MPNTVGDLITEIYREWLEPPSEQPVVALLTAALNSSATTFTYADNYLSAEESFLLAPGSLIEVDSELMRVRSVNEGSNALEVLRGAEGTTAVAHDDGSVIKVQPHYPRRTVYNAVVDAIAALWPPLYDVGVEEGLTVNPDGSPTEIPHDFKQPIRVLVNEAGRWRQGNISVFNPLPSSSTHKAAVFPGVSPGSEVVLTYRRAPQIPTSEAQFLADLGVLRSWHRLIKVDVLLEVVSVSDISRLTPRFTSSLQELELNPITAASEVRNRLIQYREYLLERALADLEHEYGAILTSSDGTF